MTTNQEGRQAAIRESTSTAYGVAADWHALFDDAGISAGTFNERLLAWINDQLGTSYSNLLGAMAAYAADAGYNAWSSISTLVLGGASTLLSGETDGLAFDFTDSSARIKDTSTPANEYSSTGIVSSGSLVGPSGKLTYTSPSNKLTRQADGYYKYQAHNLCLQSEDAATTWSAGQTGVAISAAVTANYAANPIDGAQTADRIVFDLDGNTSTGDISFWQQTIADTQGATYVVEIWVRSTDASSSYVVQLLTPGGAVSKTVTGTWAKISTTIAADGTSSTFGIRTRGGQTPTNSDVADILVFAAHKYRYPANTDYIRTTTAAKYALPLEYSATDGSCLGLLVEEVRTNLETNSTGTTTVLNVSATASSGTAPNGLNEAVLIAATSASLSFLYSLPTLADSTTYCVSQYMKAGTTDWVFIRTRDKAGATKNTFFDLTNGSIGTDEHPTSGIENVGNGWFRCWVTFASATGATAPLVGHGPAAADNDTSANGLNFLYWHRQTEAGSFPTSPIVTYGAAASRLVDNISIATSAFPVNLSAGTLLASWKSLSTSVSANNGIGLHGTSASADRVQMRAGTFYCTGSSTTQTVSPSGGGVSTSVVNRIIAYASNDLAGCVNGGTVATQGTNTVPTSLTTLDLNIDRSTSLNPNGVVSKIVYVPRRKTDAELQAETT